MTDISFFTALAAGAWTVVMFLGGVITGIWLTSVRKPKCELESGEE